MLSQAKAEADFLRGQSRDKIKIEEEIAFDRYRGFADQLDRRIFDSSEKLEQIERTYREAARLQAPIAMWEDKEFFHKTNSDSAFRNFFIVIGMSSIVIALIIGSMVFYSRDFELFLLPRGCSDISSQNCAGLSSRAYFLIFSAISLFTLVLWFARLQLKVYFSERHLSLDARERIAFSRSYVALLTGYADKDLHLDSVAKSSREQEAIILASLFRPSQNGILSDDHSLDPSISAAIAKILSR